MKRLFLPISLKDKLYPNFVDQGMPSIHYTKESVLKNSTIWSDEPEPDDLFNTEKGGHYSKRSQIRTFLNILQYAQKADRQGSLGQQQFI